MSPRRHEAIERLPFFAENEATYHTATAQNGKLIRIFSKESLIDELLKIHAMGWVENRRKGNAGSVGNVLEDLLGIEENNLPIPNATEWELKSQRIGTTSLTTLFHMGAFLKTRSRICE